MIHRPARVLAVCLALLPQAALLASETAPVPATDAPAAAPRAEAPPSPELAQWIDLCIRHLVSTDEAVSNGATVALRMAGSAARPALEQAAKSDDPKLGAAAQQLLTRLSTQSSRARSEGYGDAIHRQAQAHERLIDALAPREDQRPKLEALLLEQERNRTELVRKVREGEMDRTAFTEALSTLQRETEEKLAAVLDEAQLESYRKLTRPAGRS